MHQSGSGTASEVNRGPSYWAAGRRTGVFKPWMLPYRERLAQAYLPERRRFICDARDQLEAARHRSGNVAAPGMPRAARLRTVTRGSLIRTLHSARITGLSTHSDRPYQSTAAYPENKVTYFRGPHVHIAPTVLKIVRQKFRGSIFIHAAHSGECSQRWHNPPMPEEIGIAPSDRRLCANNLLRLRKCPPVLERHQKLPRLPNAPSQSLLSFSPMVASRKPNATTA
jgi:hypothetical protein